MSSGALGPPLNLFLYGPAHVVYHGFRIHLRSFPFNMLFSQVATPLSSPRPFLDPQLAPQLGITRALVPTLTFLLIPLTPPSLPGAVA